MKDTSLRSLLLLLLLPLFVLMGAALFAASLDHTRDFLRQQLHSHAQDAASALALRLAPEFANHDDAAIASAVDALHDSGYYRSIRVERPDGTPMLAREATPAVEGVPAWFTRLLPIAAPEARAEVMQGWRRAAVLRVASHPGYAYQQLWRDARSTLAWTLGFCAVGGLLLAGMLGRALRPLADMERLALEVAQGRFARLPETARVRELQHIGAALNHMSEAVARMLAEKAEAIDRLRAELQQDAMTGLANRDYFQSALDEATRTTPGGLILLQVSGLAQVNAVRGRDAGDHLLGEVARLVGEAGERRHALAARLGGTQFALLLEGRTADALLEGAEDLAWQIDALLARDGLAGETTVHAGCAAFDGGAPAELLARADAALRDATLGPSANARLASGEAPPRQAMRARLREALDTARIELAWQPLLRCADRIVEHREALARLPDTGGQAVSAGAFVSLAEEDGLAATLDRLVLTQAMQALAASPPTAVSVNVSPDSLRDAGLLAWLRERGHHGGRLQLECTLGRDAAEAVAGLAGLRDAGFRIVIDRFAPHAWALEQLATLRPAWVKVDGALCRHAVAHPGSRMLLRALCEYAHELGVQVAACGVERESDVHALCELGVDGVQGWAFGLPEAA
ncbi:MAG: EAL domain-containing protein [Pseudomonadota bacterium]